MQKAKSNLGWKNKLNLMLKYFAFSILILQKVSLCSAPSVIVF